MKRRRLRRVRRGNDACKHRCNGDRQVTAKNYPGFKPRPLNFKRAVGGRGLWRNRFAEPFPQHSAGFEIKTQRNKLKPGPTETDGNVHPADDAEQRHELVGPIIQRPLPGIPVPRGPTSVLPDRLPTTGKRYGKGHGGKSIGPREPK